MTLVQPLPAMSGPDPGPRSRSRSRPAGEAREEQLVQEIARLRCRLEQLECERERERESESGPPVAASPPPLVVSGALDPSLHCLLLVSDSALPLGSFAYSNGLESYLAHAQKPAPASASSRGVAPLASFKQFLSLSIASLASTTLPYLLHAHRHPEELLRLDDELDAATLCTVARRASLAQGLALMSVWDRSFKGVVTPGIAVSRCNGTSGAYGNGNGNGTGSGAGLSKANGAPAQLPPSFRAREALAAFSTALREVDNPNSPSLSPTLPVSGHYAPLWGALCAAMGINIEQAAYVFLLNHAKAVASAAVRKSVMGPYQAQSVLASGELQALIRARMAEHWATVPAEAAQTVPLVDLWVGRHELLYSRIFNA